MEKIIVTTADELENLIINAVFLAFKFDAADGNVRRKHAANKTWDDLNAGDFIAFTKNHSKSISIGKEYEVLGVVQWRTRGRACFVFIDDYNDLRVMSKRAKHYEMQIVERKN